MVDTEGSVADAEDALSVVDRVLVEFTKVLAEEEGFGDIANRLKETLLDKRDMSETALGRAIFEVEQP
ncbi:hypothetical protein [Acidiphilium multivorum]|uniref:hypothetical protein n=1 Tax=Acidiphilium multivorum TaxID=62140 RepID=UPI001B8BBC2B|nr:hypothetical protein [Acidiphilium multivorum]MBS3025645.1 hypothetical protein [Acidiphilium multivorum]